MSHISIQGHGTQTYTPRGSDFDSRRMGHEAGRTRRRPGRSPTGQRRRRSSPKSRRRRPDVDVALRVVENHRPTSRRSPRPARSVEQEQAEQLKLLLRPERPVDRRNDGRTTEKLNSQTAGRPSSKSLAIGRRMRIPG
jgi:hypothetical protein